jgi:hypothetical protein
MPLWRMSLSRSRVRMSLLMLSSFWVSAAFHVHLHQEVDPTAQVQPQVHGQGVQGCAATAANATAG